MAKTCKQSSRCYAYVPWNGQARNSYFDKILPGGFPKWASTTVNDKSYSKEKFCDLCFSFIV